MDIPFVSNKPGPDGRYTENMYLDPETDTARAALVIRPGLKPIQLTEVEAAPGPV